MRQWRISDAVDEQTRQAKFFVSEDALSYVEWVRRVAVSNRGGVDFWLSDAQRFTGMVNAALEDADTHYIAGDVCDVLEQSAHKLPPEAPLRESLFRGDVSFYYFARALPLPGTQGTVAKAILTLKIKDQDYPESNTTKREGLLMIMFSVPEDNQGRRPMLNGIGFWSYGRAWSGADDPDLPERLDRELDFVPEELEGYGGNLPEGVRANRQLTAKDAKATFVQERAYLMALWAFELQRLTAITHEQPDRATRHRLEREMQPVPLVRVVKLRQVDYVKPVDREGPTGPVRHINCRYYVEPFWRQQWYPSINQHAPKLVAAHWRGQGELRITRKVYAVVQ